MINRRIGYLVLIFLSAISVFVCAYVVDLIINPRHLRTVAFSSAGNLQIEDPVKMQGLEVGRVKDMIGTGRNALVTLEFYEKITIYPDYRISTHDKGILGERIITLDPGTSGKPVPVTDTLYGRFQPGISELVGQAWKLKRKIKEFVHVTDEMLNGTQNSPSLVSRYETIVSETDRITAKVAEVISIIHYSFNDQIHSLDSILRTTDRYISASIEKTPKYMATAQNLINHTHTALASLQTLSSDVQTTIATLKDEDGLLMGDRVALIEQNLNKISSLSKEIRRNGYNLRVLLSFRR